MRLGARPGVKRSGAEPGAIAACAIPLGEAAACCGAENLDFHEGILQGAKRKCKPGWRNKDVQRQNGPIAAAVGPHNSRLQFSVGVRADFAIQIDLFVLRGDPFHSDGSFIHVKSTVSGTAKRYHTNSRKGTGLNRLSEERPGRVRTQEDEHQAKVIKACTQLFCYMHSLNSTRFAQIPRNFLDMFTNRNRMWPRVVQSGCR